MYEAIFNLNTKFSDIQKLHGAVRNVLSEVRDDDRQYVYRVFQSPDHEFTRIWVRSNTTINSEFIQWRQKSLDIDNGDDISISIAANPIKRNGNKDILLRTEEEVEAFFIRLAVKAGIDVDSITVSDPEKWQKNKKGLRGYLVTQEAVITGKVNDAKVFEEYYLKGVSRYKHYGLGMIVRLN